jgi:hypothetical protein
LEDASCEVAGSRADFEDGVGLLEEGFVDDGIGDARVLEDVLALGGSAWVIGSDGKGKLLTLGWCSS